MYVPAPSQGCRISAFGAEVVFFNLTALPSNQRLKQTKLTHDPTAQPKRHFPSCSPGMAVTVEEGAAGMGLGPGGCSSQGRSI